MRSFSRFGSVGGAMFWTSSITWSTIALVCISKEIILMMTEA